MQSDSIIPFDFDGNAVRVVLRDGDPWFVAKDICDVLDIGNHRQAISRLDDDEKGVTSSDTLGGKQNMTCVTESGLYSLIFTSRKPEARRFRKWVTSEVLPAIRRTGGYSMNPAETLPEFEFPDQAFFLKPSQRAAALNTAMQMVKLIGGSLEDLDMLYGRYCALLGARPKPIDALEVPENSADETSAYCRILRRISEGRSYTSAGVQRLLSCGKTKFWEMLKAGEFPNAFRVGRVIRIPEKDVRDYQKRERIAEIFRSEKTSQTSI